MGGVVSPVLAGFALATIAVLVTSADPNKTPLAPWAVLCLALAGVAFLYVMQYSFLAMRSGSPPSSYTDWEPEVALEPERLEHLRLEQAADRRLFLMFNKRAGWLYDLALLLFLAGLALVIVPARWGVPNVIAVTVVGLAFVVEVLWILADPVAAIGHLLSPVRGDVEAEVRSTVDDIDPSDLRRLGLLR
jgi:hypothetical protein